MTTTVRFAPSPTGLLHVGSARLALVNWLFAAARGGTFLLRLDDTDAGPSTAESAIAVERDLLWLGLEWGAFARRSERQERYREACDRLRAAGRLYAADGAAGDGPTEWRFRVDDGDIAWDDLVQGEQRFAGATLSDPVLVRGDGTYPCILPSAVDDIDLGVTHVIRGENHLADTPLQIRIIEALGATPPAFAHLPPLADLGGEEPSGRLASPTVESLRDEGIEPMALNSLLAGLGRGDAIEPSPTLDDLAAGFDLSAYGRATPGFDPDQLGALNAKLLRSLPYEAVAKRLADMGLERADAGFWKVVRPHLARLGQAGEWHAVCFGDVAPIIEDLDLVLAAAELLPPEPWDEGTWHTWTGRVAAKTGRAGGDLFRPLRLAVTGADYGPDMATLLPLIGRARVRDRIGGG